MADGEPMEVMVRTYAGQNQAEAAALFAQDALDLAAAGWVPVTQVWVADEWPRSAYIAAFVLLFVVIGLFLLVLFSIYKPVRTLMVTYQRRISSDGTPAP